MVASPYLSPATTALLNKWLAEAALQNGPLFRSLHLGRLSQEELDTSSIRRLIKRAILRAGLGSPLAADLSGHSMRIGAAQDMMVAGFDALAITGGWKSANVVRPNEELGTPRPAGMAPPRGTEGNQAGLLIQPKRSATNRQHEAAKVNRSSSSSPMMTLAAVLAATGVLLGLAEARDALQPQRQLTGDREPREADRGREATTPSEIPAPGWKDILRRVYAGISEDRIMALAAASTYYALLAIFPALAALVAIYGLFSDPNEIGNQLSQAQGLLPGGAVDVIGDQLKRVASQSSGTLGFASIAGLLVALVSANSGVKALFDSLNQVYGEKEKRGFIKLNLITLTFTIASIVLLIVAVAAIAVLPLALDRFGLSSESATIIQLVRWPLLLLVIAVGLAFVYRFGPSRREPQWRWVTWGSATAAVLWLAASILFSWYAEDFGSYNKTYGSLGAIIGFMVWLWISLIVVLLGAELDAEMEHQTARDTTSGPTKPLGEGDAYMADTIGSPNN